MAFTDFNSAPIPTSDRVVYKERFQNDPLEGLMTQPWIEYFSAVLQIMDHSVVRVSSMGVVNQSASIAATDFSGGTLVAGLYRVAYYARISQAAGTSSSLTVTMDWVDGSISCSFSGAAMTGNTTSTTQSESLLLLIDSNSPIRYSTTYASVGAPVMEYKLYAIIEKVQV